MGKQTAAEQEETLIELQGELPTSEDIEQALMNAGSCETLQDFDANLKDAHEMAMNLVEALQELIDTREAGES